jgi:hypothetical protein
VSIRIHRKGTTTINTAFTTTATTTDRARTARAFKPDYAALLAEAAEKNRAEGRENARPMGRAITAVIARHGIDAAAELVTEQGDAQDQLRLLGIIGRGLPALNPQIAATAAPRSRARKSALKRAIQYLSRNAKDGRVKTLALAAYVLL